MMYWRPYVPVAIRRAHALKKMEALRKKGKTILPVEIEGRTIARSFWGKGWCVHLESFSDYSNRLPRGRTYVRNGYVCHLDIHPGRVEAIVCGSELYTVNITIEPLPATKWNAIKQACAGHVGSMLELLQGKLSDQVMAIVTDQSQGLFPLPGEIRLTCSCPDWATMCKHVAATLYGVGSRLDLSPELMFTLRDVDAQELISSEIALPTEAAYSEAALADEALGDIFGVELDDGEPAAQDVEPVERPSSTDTAGTPPKAKRPRKTKAKVKPKSSAASFPRRNKVRKKKAAAKGASRRPSSKAVEPPVINGAFIAELRARSGLSALEFARSIRASVASVYRWEAISGPIKLQGRLRRNILELWQSLES